ncbi:SDR family oxidoreductase [Paraburkholderia rhizosphaerae]|uniref:NAD(P)-dependent dehydrogenase (Short-subunit alcohol dehydrogenase family) n=1 Tax=Paraburkholderia rhizosphaerae TaxID=480658 RepID=A0A4R8LS42_9BURK|nr:SDR family oxidoreductase [Paraburkholderia rhizosphaerae]TDY50288.1 NAD(P)-dependent dehydrogenase (short-subunit alcohol dehydrogenase family) [Paraburkholderia rhizosphaerae]
MNRLAGKVALITGAGRGIGAAIAHAFAREGAAVVLAELDLETAQRTAREIEAAVVDANRGTSDTSGGSGGSGGSAARVLAVRTDVTQSASVQHAVDEAQRAFGPLDVLVNNAGINVFCDPLTMTDDDWRRCFAVDLDGVWNGCRAALPGMVERGRGSIVNIASTHSFKIIPGCFPYPVAKHGVIGLTRALGIEYAPRHVRVNAIAPGYIETQLTRDWWDNQPDPAAAQQATLDLQPMKRIGRPDEVAMTAVFLASDEAPFINASCITVDGGRSALYHD